MSKYKFTNYFENEVWRKRPYIMKEWCIRVITPGKKRGKEEDMKNHL